MSTATKLMTADELLDLPGGFRYELVKGELLTMSPAGEEHGAVIMNLAVPLGQFVKANKLGRVYGAETGFKLESNPDTVLAPDIAFIEIERLGTLVKTYRAGHLTLPWKLSLRVKARTKSKRRPSVGCKAAPWQSGWSILKREQLQ